jgi:hypothetical protein
MSGKEGDGGVGKETRVPTTVLRKRQISELRAQERSLQSHVAVLQRRQGSAETTAPQDELLRRLDLQGEALRDLINGHQLAIERAQLMLSKRLVRCCVHVDCESHTLNPIV